MTIYVDGDTVVQNKYSDIVYVISGGKVLHTVQADKKLKETELLTAYINYREGVKA